MEQVTYTAFDAEEHLGGVLGIFVSDGCTGFSLSATRSSMTTPGVRTVVAVVGTKVAGVLQAHLSLGRLAEVDSAKSGARTVDLISGAGSEGISEAFDHGTRMGFRIFPGAG